MMNHFCMPFWLHTFIWVNTQKLVLMLMSTWGQNPYMTREVAKFQLKMIFSHFFWETFKISRFFILEKCRFCRFNIWNFLNFYTNTEFFAEYDWTSYQSIIRYFLLTKFLKSTLWDGKSSRIGSYLHWLINQQQYYSKLVRWNVLFHLRLITIFVLF